MGKFFTILLKGMGSILSLMGLLILGTFILFVSRCSMNMAEPGVNTSTSPDSYLYLFGGVGIIALIMILGVIFFTVRGIFRHFKK